MTLTTLTTVYNLVDDGCVFAVAAVPLPPALGLDGVLLVERLVLSLGHQLRPALPQQDRHRPVEHVHHEPDLGRDA